MGENFNDMAKEMKRWGVACTHAGGRMVFWVFATSYATAMKKAKEKAPGITNIKIEEVKTW